MSLCKHGCGKDIPSANGRIKHPLDSKATAAADKKVYTNCKHLTDSSGKKRSLTMKQDDKPCRKLWVAEYLAHQKAKPAKDKPTPKPAPAPAKKKKPGDIIEKCPKGGLAVEVKDQAGKPIEGAIIDVVGIAASFSDKSGVADFGEVAVGPYTVTVEKRGYGPSATDPAGKVVASGTVVNATTVVIRVKIYPVEQVTKIKGRMPATHGVRKASNKRTSNKHASIVANKSLTTNPPVVLVRGCREITLEAITSPAGKAVDWKVEANDTAETAPTLTPTDGGKKAILKTNKWGSFAVTAELGGKKIVWNVVYVWVKVDTASTVMTKRNAGYVDTGSSTRSTGFRSGQFSAGNYAWEAKVNVKLFGGGADNKLGINKIQVKTLQNGITDTLTGVYSHLLSTYTALEVPLGGMPIVDSNDATQPFIYLASSATIKPSQTVVSRVVWTGDSPAGGFNGNAGGYSIFGSLARLKSIRGVNGFKTSVASFSNDARNSIIVHASMSWTADYAGKVNDSTGIYTKSTANTTSNARYSLIGSSTGGKDAKKANYETFQPRFNQGTNTTWSG